MSRGRDRGRLRDALPDVRDGLTRRERIVLRVLEQTQLEFPGRRVPTATLYGRVVEVIDLEVDELQAILVRLGAAVRDPATDGGG